VVEALRVYRQLLANRALTKLLLGEFISGIGDWLYIVAIFVVIYRETNDPAAVGAFGAVRMIPYILLSIPAGLAADRFDRRLVLLASDLVRGSVMIVMTILVATHGPVLLIVAFAMVAAGGSTFFYPAIGAYIPSLATDERQLGPANSAWSSLGNLSFIVGPAIGGLLIALGDVTLAFVLNAATFVVIALILWTLPPSVARRSSAGPAGEAGAAGTADAGATATDTPSGTAPATDAAATAPPIVAPPGPRVPVRPMAGLALIQVVVGFLDGGIQALTIILAVTVLKAGEDANGYLNAAIGVGGLAGAIVSGVLVLRRQLAGPMVIGGLLTAAGVAALGGIPVLAIALVAIGISSAGSIVLDVVLTTVFQRLVPDELRGRALGLLMTLNTVSGASGAFILPIVVVGFGAGVALGGAGLAVAIATIVGTFLMGATTSRPASPFESTLLRVAKLPLFAGVRGSRLEAALDHVRPMDVQPGQTIVRQGEPADRFYIIVKGAFSVSQTTDAGTEVELRTLGADQVFGELGLLNRTARTATVTATAPGTLLEMDGDDFLELVGASGDLRGRLLGLYSGPGSVRTG
jgi:MFS family permease